MLGSFDAEKISYFNSHPDVLVSEDTVVIGTAFEGGDYLIQVGGTRGNVSYILEVTLGIE